MYSESTKGNVNAKGITKNVAGYFAKKVTLTWPAVQGIFITVAR